MTTESGRKYGILGGTFNPIHSGHVELAWKALTQFGLDKVLVMPNNVPDYKDVSGEVSTAHRINMIHLAIDGCSGLEYSDFELRRSGITYTSDTLTELHRLYPEIHWYFIMGGDSITYFDKWHEPEVITRLATLVVSSRKDVTETEVCARAAGLGAVYPYADIRLLHMDGIDVSSSNIRQLVRSGEDIHGMVPSGVEEYIYKNRLYQQRS